MTEAKHEEAPAIDKSDAAEASSAHARINVPINLENWKELDEDIQEDLLWFHQHVLDEHLGWKDASEALGYDTSVVFKVLKGTYEGSWKNIRKAIASFKQLSEQRGTIQRNTIVRNEITDLVGSGLDYALANNSITLIVGEARMGKTEAVNLWRAAHNHGRSVYIVAPPCGGAKMLLTRVARRLGINKGMNVPQMFDAILRAFNPHRILIVDEAHRLLPEDSRTNPTNLEILRDIHDQTHCAMAFISTERFNDKLARSHYQFEQLLGRIGMPIRLPEVIGTKTFLPILTQYIAKPSPELVAECRQMANSCGRLAILVEVLKFASRIATKDRNALSEKIVFKAMAIRRKMMGKAPSWADGKGGDA